MLPILNSAKRLAKKIQLAANSTAAAFEAGEIAQEPAFTDRMLGRIDAAVETFKSRGIRWGARTLTDRGLGAEEARFGADFAGVFQASTKELTVSKGFLAQAKRLGLDKKMAKSDLERLREQCDRMLSFTPASFVFLYDTTGVRIISATAVVNSDTRNLDALATMTVNRFYRLHFECFIGDARMGSPTAAGLATLGQGAAPRVQVIEALAQ